MANKMESMENIKLEIEAAKTAGFSNEEIQNSYADEINAAQSSGFSEDQINKTYGFAEPDNKIIKDYVNKITKDYLSEEIVSPEDEMLYQSKLERGKPVKEAVKDIKETLVGKEFDGSYIAEQILGNNLYNFSKRAIKGRVLQKHYVCHSQKIILGQKNFLQQQVHWLLNLLFML